MACLAECAATVWGQRVVCTTCCYPPASRPSLFLMCTMPPNPDAQGVLEEIGLIKWPAPLKAAVQTVLVIVIVAGTAASLLAINGLLTELGKLY